MFFFLLLRGAIWSKIEADIVERVSHGIRALLLHKRA